MTAYRALLWIAVLALSASAMARKAPPRKGWLGIQLKPATTEQQSRHGFGRAVPRVVRVFKGSPAETSGIQSGDFVLELQQKPVLSVADLVKRVGSQSPGTEVGLVLHREGRARAIRVVLDLRLDMRERFRKEWLGKKMPAVSVTDVETGAKVDLSPPATRGRVILVDYFATWCGPCRRVMPRLEHLQRTYGVRGLEVIGVSGEKHTVVKEWAKRNPVAYTLTTDDTGEFRRELAVSVLPTIWVVDRAGVIEKIFFGAGHIDVLEALIQGKLNINRSSGPFKR